MQTVCDILNKRIKKKLEVSKLQGRVDRLDTKWVLPQNMFLSCFNDIFIGSFVIIHNAVF